MKINAFYLLFVIANSGQNRKKSLNSGFNRTLSQSCNTLRNLHRQPAQKICLWRCMMQKLQFLCRVSENDLLSEFCQAEDCGEVLEVAERELRKMRRSELIEIIYALKTREEELTRKTEELERKLEQREILLSEAGSIAQAAMGLNRVFEAAQAAADDYLASVKAANPINLDKIQPDASEQCADGRVTALPKDADSESTMDSGGSR